MAKKTGPKETSLPVIVALVFFVLMTIGLGVFCYVLYSDQEAKDAAVAKAQQDLKNARTGEAEAQQSALVTRVFSGTHDGDDLEKFSQIKEGDKAYQELARLNKLYKDRAPAAATAAANRFNTAMEEYFKAVAARDPNPPKLDVSNFVAADLWVPQKDANGNLRPPTTSLVEHSVRSQVLRDLAMKQANAYFGSYEDSRTLMASAAADYEKFRKQFEKVAGELPKTFAKELDDLKAAADTRAKEFSDAGAGYRKEIDTLTGEKEKLEVLRLKLGRDKDELNSQISNLRERLKPGEDPLQFDQPLGKITRRPAENIVEINIGSRDLVQPGLTFTVLPSDYPEKGRQSRIKGFRRPDEHGNYRTVEQFVPKGTIEVIEVLGPQLSRARITDEYDNIRERVITGDLLYNAVWRKGSADHIALVGIFDINGDGSDDIESVVRDLTKMGIPVDAYFDLKTQKWAGQLTQRTRYLVEGYTPLSSANDPNREAKTKMVGSMTAAKEEAANRGIKVLDFRDFFGKTGYRVKLDVSEARINQAASRYLTGTGVAEPPPGAPN
jgi:hypothetical protein